VQTFDIVLAPHWFQAELIRPIILSSAKRRQSYHTSLASDKRKNPLPRFESFGPSAILLGSS